MPSNKRIDSIEAVHQYLHNMGKVSCRYEISEAGTLEHDDMFEVYLCHKKHNESNPALLVLKKTGEIIPSGTDTDAGYYIAKVRAGRRGNDIAEIDEEDLYIPEEIAEFDQDKTDPNPDGFEIIDD